LTSSRTGQKIVRLPWQQQKRHGLLRYAAICCDILLHAEAGCDMLKQAEAC
jgi:hypothetical protein